MSLSFDARTRRNRRFARALARLVLRLFTRTTITGQEHLQTPGPVIYAANHASTFDAVLFVALLPPDATFVGPGDFKLLWPGNWAIRSMGLIPMKRGAVDRAGLKHLLDVLKAGGRLGMFPEGGTWEKAISDVKSGVTYLSYAADAKLVLMAYGGTYQVWKRIARLQRPRINITIAPPLPPVSVSGTRARRQDELQAAALDLMRQLYDLLPAADQERFDRLARTRYHGVIHLETLTPQQAAEQAEALADLDAIPLDALAELVLKPNLFSPLHRNAGLPLRPLVRHGRAFPAEELGRAARALRAALTTGDYANYLEYRLGDAKAEAVRAALDAIQTVMAGAPLGARAAFVATAEVVDADEALPPPP